MKSQYSLTTGEEILASEIQNRTKEQSISSNVEERPSGKKKDPDLPVLQSRNLPRRHIFAGRFCDVVIDDLACGLTIQAPGHDEELSDILRSNVREW